MIFAEEKQKNVLHMPMIPDHRQGKICSTQYAISIAPEI